MNVTLMEDRPASRERRTPTMHHVENPVPESVGVAREWLSRTLRRAGITGDPADSAVLILSELFTNALQHGRPGASIGVSVATVNGTLLIAVTDTPDPTTRHDPRPQAEHGRGLDIVDALADKVDHDSGPGYHTATATISYGGA